MHPYGIAITNIESIERTKTMMTYEEFEKKSKDEQVSDFLKVVEEAKKDDTPYVAYVDDEVHVIGDPNKTELKKHEYTVDFAIPNTAENKARLKASGIAIEFESDNYLRIKRDFKNVFVSARRATDIAEAFTRVQAFINKVTIRDEDGELDIRLHTEDEMLEVMAELNTEIEDAMYRAVGTFFGLNQYDTDSMLLPSVIYNVIMIAVNNPEVINGSDVFFGYSQGSK